MDDRKRLGRLGEERACELLVQAGFAIVARNHKVQGVEIDVIAQRDGWLVFGEVKTRSLGCADPLAAISPRQRQRLLRAISAFMRINNLRLSPRIDIFAVEAMPDGRLVVEHHPDAIHPHMRFYG